MSDHLDPQTSRRHPSSPPKTHRPSSRPTTATSSTASSALDSVPEDTPDVPWVSSSSSPPRARSSSFNQLADRRPSKPSGKGKAKDDNNSPKPKCAWVVDPVETSDGAARWETADRVILVLGDPTPLSLAPILYNPSFSNTLLLIGSDQPARPEFTHMASPSYLLSSERPIYPSVQPFSPKPSRDASHPLAALIARATELAEAYRHAPKSKSRRDSMDSASLAPSRSSLSLRVFRRGSEPDTDRVSMFEETDSPRFSRARLPSFTSSPMKRKDSNSTHPFDTILHFLPPAASNPRALHDLLHQTMVLTTGLMPLLTAPYPVPSPEPTTVLHVLPPDAPLALGPVIEQFIVSLLPAMQAGDQQVWAGATSLKAWMAPRVGSSDPTFNFIGAEVLLFNGLRACIPANVQAPVKQRVYLPTWSECVHVPGLLRDSHPSPASSELNTPHSSPPTPHPSDLLSRDTLDRSHSDPALRPTPRAHPRSTLRNSFSFLDLDPNSPSLSSALGLVPGKPKLAYSETVISSPSLSTPELLHSGSSFESSSASVSARNSQEAAVESRPKEKKGGFRWLRFKMKN